MKHTQPSTGAEQSATIRAFRASAFTSKVLAVELDINSRMLTESFKSGFELVNLSICSLSTPASIPSSSYNLSSIFLIKSLGLVTFPSLSMVGVEPCLFINALTMSCFFFSDSLDDRIDLLDFVSRSSLNSTLAFSSPSFSLSFKSASKSLSWSKSLPSSVLRCWLNKSSVNFSC